MAYISSKYKIHAKKIIRRFKERILIPLIDLVLFSSIYVSSILFTRKGDIIYKKSHVQVSHTASTQLLLA